MGNSSLSSLPLAEDFSSSLLPLLSSFSSGLGVGRTGGLGRTGVALRGFIGVGFSSLGWERVSMGVR